MLAQILAAAPGIASALGGLFGKKKSGGDTQPGQIVLPAFQQLAGEQLGQFIRQFLSQYTPGKDYTGQLSAPLTSQETTGLDQLTSFLNAPTTGDLFNTAKNTIMDTASGKYADINSSPYIQAMINLSKNNLSDAINANRRSSGARGNFFSSAAIRSEDKAASDAQTGLDAVVGQFINQERGRQLDASTMAANLDKYANIDAPLAKVTASQTLGSLSRTVQQADLERQYNDFLRKQQELGGTVGAAQSLFGTNTPYVPSYTTPVTQQNNTLGNILSIISKLNLGGLAGGGSIWDKIGSIFGGG